MPAGRAGALMVAFGTNAPALARRFRAALGGGGAGAAGDGLTMDGGLGGFWGMLLPLADILRGWGRVLFIGCGAFFPAVAIFGDGAALGIVR